MFTANIERPTWIDRPEQLRRLAADLVHYPRIGVDTESNSMYVYREQVCLIQFSTPERDYLVDPLALRDLSPLADFFASEKIEKIFHAAEYDLICLKRDFDFSFSNIFDTMVAGRVLGWNALGLAAMLHETFGLVLDKRFQRANWARRPLTPEMMAYAQTDTHYLIPLRDHLKKTLQEKDRWVLAQEDFRRECNVSLPNTENGGANNCWKVAGNQDLTPEQIGVLRALCEYREEQARNANLPPFKIMGNKTLLQIALRMPRSEADLAQVEGMSPRLLQRHGTALMRTIHTGMHEKYSPRPHNNHRPSEDYLLRLDALRSWRKETGLLLGVSSDVVLPRDTLEVIAQANPQHLDDLRPLMNDMPWRYRRFGKSILRIIHR
ncbi:MAG: ribonuclease D [Chloroflexi bacterium]|nr:HRDC domain-containing protein [Anaerolineaceae bacterium]NMB87055.1 ribonuclease D [Chloroflexota bacterium]